MNLVYILFSPSINKYYIGETEDISRRFEEHNSTAFPGSYTARARDWELFISIECEDRIEARRIEHSIKRMKSRSFIEKLKKQPSLIDNLRTAKG